MKADVATPANADWRVTGAGVVAYNSGIITGADMPLVPCRACGHTVDTSALACPQCGATNPGRKLSRQQSDLIVLVVQLIVGFTLLFVAGNWVWNQVGPIVKAQLSKPAQ